MSIFGKLPENIIRATGGIGSFSPPTIDLSNIDLSNLRLPQQTRPSGALRLGKLLSPQTMNVGNGDISNVDLSNMQLPREVAARYLNLWHLNLL